MSTIKNIDLNRIIKYSFKQLVKDWKFFVFMAVVFYIVTLLSSLGDLFLSKEKLVLSVITLLVFLILYIALYFIYEFYLYKSTLKNKKSFSIRFKQLILENKGFAGKFFLYSLLFALFFFAIFFALPGILIALILQIFSDVVLNTTLITIIVVATLVLLIKYAVSWQFYPFLLVQKIEKKQHIKFMDLLKNSEKLVKGNWWLVFGIGILRVLIVSVFTLVGYLLVLPLSLLGLYLETGSVVLLITLITDLILMIVYGLEIPFSILYSGELFKQLKKLK